jgi:hypothetical protein
MCNSGRRDGQHSTAYATEEEGRLQCTADATAELKVKGKCFSFFSICSSDRVASGELLSKPQNLLPTIFMSFLLSHVYQRASYIPHELYRKESRYLGTNFRDIHIL